MQKSRSLPRVLGIAVAVALVAALLAVVALGQSGGERSGTMNRSMVNAVALTNAIEGCAVERADRRYQGGDGTDCLSLTELGRHEPALRRMDARGTIVHLTSVVAGRGYVLQVGNDTTGWFIVAHDASGQVTRLCSRATLASLRPDASATFSGCEAGRWSHPRFDGG